MIKIEIDARNVRKSRVMVRKTANSKKSQAPKLPAGCSEVTWGESVPPGAMRETVDASGAFAVETVVKPPAPKAEYLWKKGQSGNPNGRPKVVGELRDLAREHTPTALRALIEVAGSRSAPESARVAAATAILDRGYGKPLQQIEAKIEFLDTLNDADQRALLAALANVAGREDEAGSGAETTH